MSKYFEKCNLEQIRENVQLDLKKFIPNITHMPYVAGIEKELYQTKLKLIEEAAY